MRTLNASLLLVGLLLAACGGPAKDTSAPAGASAEPTPGIKEVGGPTIESTPAPAEEEVDTGPECAKDSDCTIFADCCTCKAIATSKPYPTPCESVCGEAPCQVKGKTIDDVICKNQRCTLK